MKLCLNFVSIYFLKLFFMYWKFCTDKIKNWILSSIFLRVLILSFAFASLNPIENLLSLIRCVFFEVKIPAVFSSLIRFIFFYEWSGHLIFIFGVFIQLSFKMVYEWDMPLVLIFKLFFWILLNLLMIWCLEILKFLQYFTVFIRIFIIFTPRLCEQSWWRLLLFIRCDIRVIDESTILLRWTRFFSHWAFTHKTVVSILFWVS